MLAHIESESTVFAYQIIITIMSNLVEWSFVCELYFFFKQKTAYEI